MSKYSIKVDINQSADNLFLGKENETNFLRDIRPYNGRECVGIIIAALERQHEQGRFKIKEKNSSKKEGEQERLAFDVFWFLMRQLKDSLNVHRDTRYISRLVEMMFWDEFRVTAGSMTRAKMLDSFVSRGDFITTSIRRGFLDRGLNLQFLWSTQGSGKIFEGESLIPALSVTEVSCLDAWSYVQSALDNTLDTETLQNNLQMIFRTQPDEITKIFKKLYDYTADHSLVGREDVLEVLFAAAILYAPADENFFYLILAFVMDKFQEQDAFKLRQQLSDFMHKIWSEKDLNKLFVDMFDDSTVYESFCRTVGTWLQIQLAFDGELGDDELRKNLKEIFQTKPKEVEEAICCLYRHADSLLQHKNVLGIVLETIYSSYNPAHDDSSLFSSTVCFFEHDLFQDPKAFELKQTISTFICDLWSRKQREQLMGVEGNEELLKSIENNRLENKAAA